MELFEEYEAIKIETNKARRKFENLLDKKAEYFYKTQPQSGDTEEQADTKSNSSKQLNYTLLLEKIEKKIDNQRELLKNREERLKLKEIELRASKEILDRVYVYCYLDHLKVSKFYRLIGYSKAQVYRKIEEIKQKNER